jgi:hypothetical protein
MQVIVDNSDWRRSNAWLRAIGTKLSSELAHDKTLRTEGMPDGNIVAALRG